MTSKDVHAKILEHKAQVACGMAFDYGALIFLAARFVRGSPVGWTQKHCPCPACAERRALKALVACIV